MEIDFDLIVKGGMIVDGSGNPWFKGDVGVLAGRITTVGDLSGARALRSVDARARVVSPGFIDIHNHSEFAVLLRPTADSLVQQGVTTIVTGNCGEAAAPMSSHLEAQNSATVRSLAARGISWQSFADYLGQVESQGASVNVAALIGHGTVRAAVMGWDNRRPDTDELGRMRSIVADAMQAGVFGMSTGLGYAPGFFADTDELIQLNSVVGRHRGFYTSHIRPSPSRDAFRAAVLEALEIGERGGTAIHVSHLESHYPNWGMQAEILALLEVARDRGLDASCDVPPYLLGATSLSSVLTDWAQEGGFSRLLERLRDESTRQALRDDAVSRRMTGGVLLLRGHWDRIWIQGSERNPAYSGHNLAEIAGMRGQQPCWDTVFDLLVEEGSDLAISGQWHDEQDLRFMVTHPLSMIESDSQISVSESGAENPRGFGTFPMIFRKYVRGETRSDEPREPGKRILTLEEAVRKMTSFPAQRLGLRDRGLVREGMWADLVVFDPDTIADRATYADPRQSPAGIDQVLVNGEIVVEAGTHTGKLAGRMLRSSSFRSG